METFTASELNKPLHPEPLNHRSTPQDPKALLKNKPGPSLHTTMQAYLCTQCDKAIHEANSIASSHERRDVWPFTEEELNPGGGGEPACSGSAESGGGGGGGTRSNPGEAGDDELFRDLLDGVGLAGGDAFAGLPDISEGGGELWDAGVGGQLHGSGGGMPEMVDATSGPHHFLMDATGGGGGGGGREAAGEDGYRGHSSGRTGYPGIEVKMEGGGTSGGFVGVGIGMLGQKHSSHGEGGERGSSPEGSRSESGNGGGGEGEGHRAGSPGTAVASRSGEGVAGLSGAEGGGFQLNLDEYAAGGHNMDDLLGPMLDDSEMPYTEENANFSNFGASAGQQVNVDGGTNPANHIHNRSIDHADSTNVSNSFSPMRQFAGLSSATLGTKPGMLGAGGGDSVVRGVSVGGAGGAGFMGSLDGDSKHGILGGGLTQGTVDGSGGVVSLVGGRQPLGSHTFNDGGGIGSRGVGGDRGRHSDSASAVRLTQEQQQTQQRQQTAFAQAQARAQAPLRNQNSSQ